MRVVLFQIHRQTIGLRVQIFSTSSSRISWIHKTLTTLICEKPLLSSNFRPRELFALALRRTKTFYRCAFIPSYLENFKTLKNNWKLWMDIGGWLQTNGLQSTSNIHLHGMYWRKLRTFHSWFELNNLSFFHVGPFIFHFLASSSGFWSIVRHQHPHFSAVTSSLILRAYIPDIEPGQTKREVINKLKYVRIRIDLNYNMIAYKESKRVD